MSTLKGTLKSLVLDDNKSNFRTNLTKQLFQHVVPLK